MAQVAQVARIEKCMSSPGRPGLPRRFICLSPIIPTLSVTEYGGWQPPRGWGELGPRKKCTVMVKVAPPPGPWGWGRTKLSGEEEWRAGQRAGSTSSKRCPMEDNVAGRGVQPKT